MTTTKLVYVAGKYSDPRGAYYVDQNIREARGVAVEVMKLGIAVHSPHLNTAFMDGMFSYEEFLAFDFLILDRCDGIVMIPNWSASEGAQREHGRAILKEKEVFYWPKDKIKLSQWGRGLYPYETDEVDPYLASFADVFVS